MNNKVALLRCDAYEQRTVDNSLSKAIELIGGIDSFIKRGDTVLIKPNLLSGKPPEHCISPHPALLDGILSILADLNCKCIIGDSPAVGSGISAAKKVGYFEVAERYNAKLVNFDRSVVVKSTKNKVFNSLEIDETFNEIDKVINLAKVKTHAQMFMTLSVKNMFGAIVGPKKAQWHLKCGIDNMFFAKMLIELYYHINPCLNIVDGIMAMEGNGPGNGNPIKVGGLYVGTDGLAVDRVICESLKINSDRVFIFPAARELGINNGNLDNIEIVGDGLSSINVKSYNTPQIITVDGWGILPDFVKNRAKNSLTSRPFIDHYICTKCQKCVNVCPAKVMKLNNSKIEINYENCIRCFCCQEICPEGAITAKKGIILKVLKNWL